MAETMNPIYFKNYARVSRLAEILAWREKLPDQAISLMASAVTNGKAVLVLESPIAPDYTGASALVMPGHDEGFLLMHIFCVTPFDSTPRCGEVIVSPENQVFSLVGQALKKDALAFSPEVKSAFEGWRK